MKDHSIFGVQAICLLIYVGHNVGQSDRISVLLAAGSRIAQCLGIHRLSPDKPSSKSDSKSQGLLEEKIIEREVSKRVWWFLVRQDWLQIPFNNTYSIHPTQFTTPMPNNCDEEIPLMISQGSIRTWDQEHYTQGSYTAVLNQGKNVYLMLGFWYPI